MKIPLPDQIAEAELHRKALEKAAADKPELLPRLHRSEAIVLTLRAYQEFCRRLTLFHNPNMEE